MQKLIIEPTLNSPRIILDPAAGVFEFSGESRPENVRSFFAPVMEWLEEYAGGSPSPGTFVFNFDYFNSTSAKYILDIFKILKSISDKIGKLTIQWLYEEDDEDMYEVGMEMSRMSGLTFKYVKIDV
jgi:hypothetical protein